MDWSDAAKRREGAFYAPHLFLFIEQTIIHNFIIRSVYLGSLVFVYTNQMSQKWRKNEELTNDNEGERTNWTLKDETIEFCVCMCIFRFWNIMRCIQIDCCAHIVSQPLLAFSSAGILFYHSKSHFTWPKNVIKQSGPVYSQFILLPIETTHSNGAIFVFIGMQGQKWPFLRSHDSYLLIDTVNGSWFRRIQRCGRLIFVVMEQVLVASW